MRTGRPLIVLAAAAGLAFGGCTKQARRDRAMAAAESAVKSGDYAAAEVSYRKALRFSPLDPQALGGMATLYHDQGRSQLAYVFYKKVLDSAPPGAMPDFRVKMAEDAVALGALNNGRDEARKVLEAAPDSDEAIVLYAQTSRTLAERTEARTLIDRLSRAKGDRAGYDSARGMLDLAEAPAKAEADFRQALQVDPHFVTAMGGLASVAIRNRDFKTARLQLAAAAAAAPDRSPWKLRVIEFDIELRDWAGAKSEVEALTTHTPDFVAAWSLQMKLALMQKRLDDCDAALHQVLTRDPGNFEAMMTKGDLATARGDAKAAIESFKETVRAYGKVPIVHFNLATAYVRHKDLGPAEAELHTALKLAPQYTQAVLTLAELELTTNRPAAAIQRMQELIQREPRVPQAYLILGRAYLVSKNTDAAVETFHILTRKFPSTPDGEYRAALVLLQTQRNAEARSCLERAVAIAPGSLQAHEVLVNLDLIENHPATARERVSRLIAAQPTSAVPWLLQAKIDQATKQPDAAIKDLTRAVALDPNNSTAYLLLTRLYLSAHRTSEAEAELRALIAKTDSAGSHLQLAILLAAERKPADAEREFQRSVAINPKMVAAMGSLAWVQAESLNKLGEAEANARKAREINPEDVNIARILGWILVKKGSLREALPLLQEAAEQLPSDADAHFRLGMVQYYLGSADLARASFRRARELSADPISNAVMTAKLALLDSAPDRPDEPKRRELERMAQNEPQDSFALERLGRYDELSGDWDGAVRHYQACLALVPGNVPVMMRMAELDAGPLRNPAKALALAKAAHESAPTDPNIALTVGRLASHAGDHRWAIDLLEQAARDLPNDPSISLDLAWEYFRTGALARSGELLGEACADDRIAARPDVRSFRSMLAAAGSLDSASHAAAQAAAIVARDAHFLPAELVQAMAWEHDGQANKAADAYGRLLREAPDFSPAARRLATVDYTLGRYGDSAKLFRDVQHRNSLEPLELFYFGMSLYELKDSESQSQLQRAIAAGLPTAEAGDARKALKELSEKPL